MSDSQEPANDAEPIPTPCPSLEGRGDELDDPEILALLDFEPVPRKCEREDGWTPALQRRFIANLARTGSPGKACDALGKRRSGIDKLAKLEAAASFRDAWARAVELAQERKAARIEAGHAGSADMKLPFVDHRRKHFHRGANSDAQAEPLPGQILNEHGEYEDEDSYYRRADDARDSISVKLQRARRLFLHDISDCPAKRAAFEILTELPVDWEVAALCRPQADEPWRKPTARDPDLLLTAENGWLGEFAHGPDKKAELLAEINEWRAERGKALVCWKDEGGGEEEDEEDGD
jgi:hypothetical protein